MIKLLKTRDLSIELSLDGKGLQATGGHWWREVGFLAMDEVLECMYVKRNYFKSWYLSKISI